MVSLDPSMAEGAEGDALSARWSDGSPGGSRVSPWAERAFSRHVNRKLSRIPAALLFATMISCHAVAVEPGASLEQGYRKMYGLEFEAARNVFHSWEENHPEDPRGPASLAASYLFAELHRLGVLEMQFFVDDSIRSRRKPVSDPAVRKQFDAELGRAETMARARLSRDSQDPDALFALALVHGLRADYTALIEKRNLASLGPTREASDLAGKLLSIEPQYYDAYLATGISNYILGSLIAPVRWILRLGGYAGDKEQGMRQLEITAERGRLLAPFARLLLAIAYLREAKPQSAREMLVELRNEFPTNPLFEREIARIDARRH